MVGSKAASGLYCCEPSNIHEHHLASCHGVILGGSSPTKFEKCPFREIHIYISVGWIGTRIGTFWGYSTLTTTIAHRPSTINMRRQSDRSIDWWSWAQNSVVDPMAWPATKSLIYYTFGSMEWGTLTNHTQHDHSKRWNNQTRHNSSKERLQFRKYNVFTKCNKERLQFRKYNVALSLSRTTWSIYHMNTFCLPILNDESYRTSSTVPIFVDGTRQ